MLQAFGAWINPSGRTGLDSPAARQTATWMKGLISDGISPRAVTNYAESESLQAFKAGDAALMRNWPYAWAEQGDDSAVKGRIGVKHGCPPGESPAATLGSWGLSMLRTRPIPQPPRKRSGTSPARTPSGKLSEQGYTPTAKALFQDPELLERSRFAATGQALARPSHARCPSLCPDERSAAAPAERNPHRKS